MVANHPNSHIYSQLLSMVDFDGYYLENKPCLVCNDPEVPYSVSGLDCLRSCIDYIPVATSKEPCHAPFLQVLKLYSMKSEVRYSPNMILFKLAGSFTVSQVSGIANYMYVHVVYSVNCVASSMYMDIVQIYMKFNVHCTCR